uniref:Cytochrome b-c1 complex subunit 6 n=1 Tax=Lepeophtheirus salmonis TaxID=72036 RepID=C1BSF9_LEPSM|nr:cytochrome b-c1 complex subunit 6, mitochondrial-like [Lepeophtheirus salmonis]XP_040565826.1 cytochrome b-c1 complex subunit 6, mitochondrial-like [Lepeophtheirus salmonis]ACO11962.1 Cytochrome b-c1 complex subunit 6, mitochondrial precursor [Lepeophtheirus salmonis]
MTSEIQDKLIPKVKAEEEEEEEEEELVDPAVEIKERCKTQACTSYVTRLETCNDRVNSKSKTSETCLEEIMDLVHCIDHCASPQVIKLCK